MEVENRKIQHDKRKIEMRNHKIVSQNRNIELHP